VDIPSLLTLFLNYNYISENEIKNLKVQNNISYSLTYQNKLPNGVNTIKYRYFTYNGETFDYIPHGKGEITINNITYNTKAEMGKFINNSQLQFHDGDIYYKIKTSKYEGDMKNDMKHGFGKIINLDNIIEANFINDEYHGDIKYIFNNGKIIECKFISV